ncbi:MAG: hypothetical protein Q4B45_08345, partial [Coriobacteriia bacterium]|nr:hypothetical protein [Coriobacteriia bacterium]
MADSPMKKLALKVEGKKAKPRKAARGAGGPAGAGRGAAGFFAGRGKKVAGRGAAGRTPGAP